MSDKSVRVSFAHAWDGLVEVSRQRNMAIHLVSAVGVVAAGMFFALDTWHWVALFSAIFAVLVVETVNSAVEATVDLITREFLPLARSAKDLAAGAVLLTALYAIVIGITVFGPPLATLLSGQTTPGAATAQGAGLSGRWPWAVLFLVSALTVVALLFRRPVADREKDVQLPK